MVDLTRTIQIIFEAVDETGQGIAAFSKGVGDLAGNLESATAPFADLTKSMLAFDAVVAGLAATLASIAIKESAQFEESLYLVKKQLDDTSPSMEQVKADIEGVGLAYGVNANEVAKATAAFLAAGYDYETSAKLVKASTDLMIAGELDAATASNAITASLAGFKVPADQAAEAATHIGDVLNKIGDISSGAFDQIVDGFKQIAPTAKDAGWSMEQTAAAIAAIVDTGFSGSEAANALKSGLVQLIDPPKDARNELERLGIQLKDGNGVSRLAGDIMADLAGKYQNLTLEAKLQTAAIIFGKDQAGKLNSLLGDWGKSQDYVAQMTDKTTGAVGSMAKEVEGKLGTLQSAIDRNNEAWRQLLEAFGSSINADKSVNALYESLKNFAITLKDLIQQGDLDPLIQPFRDAYDQIAAIFDKLAENLPAAIDKIDWTKWEGAIKDLADSFSGIFDGVDLGTPEGLAKAIQLAIDAFAGIIEVSSGVIDGLQPLFDIIAGIVKGFTELSPEVQNAIGYFLGLATTVNVVSGYAKDFAGIFGAGGQLLSGLKDLNPALKVIAVTFAAFELGKWISDWTGLGDAVGKQIETWRGIPDVVGAAADAIGRVPDNLKKISETTGIAITSMDQFNQLADEGKIIWDDVSQSWVKAGDAGGKVVDATKGIVDVQKDLNPALQEQYELMGLSADGTQKLVDTLGYYKDVIGVLDASLKAGNITQEEYDKALADLEEQAWRNGVSLDSLTKKTTENADSIDKQKKSIKDAAAESAKMALEWEKLASQEREVIFKAAAEIAVAQIEADSKRAVAAMEMLSASFQGTGEVLKSLFDMWQGLDNLADKSKVEQWIEREYALREKLAQAQIDLVQAEIERMKAQTELLDRGGVELKISSEGLEPALEAFMFAVIDKVRVQIAGSYEEFLLGCGG